MSSARLALPRLYAILDAGTLFRIGADLVEAADELRSAGVTLFQYRDKQQDRTLASAQARRVSDSLRDAGCKLILNDDAEWVKALGCDGVHVGQTDIDVFAARSLIGAHRILGISTHNEAQLQSADLGPADYVAIGPVFPTGTKADAEFAVGLQGVRKARELTSKPLVAIGGISLANLRSVLDAGADSVAVVSALFVEHRRVRENAVRLLDAASV